MKYPVSAALSAALLLGLTSPAKAEGTTSKKAIQIQLFSDADTNHDFNVTMPGATARAIARRYGVTPGLPLW